MRDLLKSDFVMTLAIVVSVVVSMVFIVMLLFGKATPNAQVLEQ